ncbi:RrF2 family transcriptional regulator [Embleya sp. MST-111070]|uniref:RrF2 family transcriptional regulator n=1 Tax=Embleya sp. MST-111070 TaxID=3398231 RepID=UPI003F741B9C
MRMGEGVEWGLHCCLVLAWLEDEGPVSTATLAAWFELPPAYLKKRLQALVRADILTSSAGARGGFLLARRPEAITLLDVVVAVEGPDELFRCAEIRRRGDGVDPAAAEFRVDCGVSTLMRQAELAYRRELAGRTIADALAAAPPAAAERARRRYARMGG